MIADNDDDYKQLQRGQQMLDCIERKLKGYFDSSNEREVEMREQW